MSGAPRRRPSPRSRIGLRLGRPGSGRSSPFGFGRRAPPSSPRRPARPSSGAAPPPRSGSAPAASAFAAAASSGEAVGIRAGPSLRVRLGGGLLGGRVVESRLAVDGDLDDVVIGVVESRRPAWPTSLAPRSPSCASARSTPRLSTALGADAIRSSHHAAHHAAHAAPHAGHATHAAPMPCPSPLAWPWPSHRTPSCGCPGTLHREPRIPPPYMPIMPGRALLPGRS